MYKETYFLLFNYSFERTKKINKEHKIGTIYICKLSDRHSMKLINTHINILEVCKRNIDKNEDSKTSSEHALISKMLHFSI